MALNSSRSSCGTSLWEPLTTSSVLSLLPTPPPLLHTTQQSINPVISPNLNLLNYINFFHRKTKLYEDHHQRRFQTVLSNQLNQTNSWNRNETNPRWIWESQKEWLLRSSNATDPAETARARGTREVDHGKKVFSPFELTASAMYEFRLL